MGEVAELTRQALPRDRAVDDLQHAFAREVIIDVEHSEATPRGQLIGDEVHRPALVGPRGHRHRDPRPAQLLAPLGAHLQAFLAIQPVGLSTSRK